jgi:hypothetical protein
MEVIKATTNIKVIIVVITINIYILRLPKYILERLLLLVVIMMIILYILANSLTNLYSILYTLYLGYKL